MWRSIFVVGFFSLWSSAGRAETCTPVTRANVAACALTHSLVVESERHQAEAIEGRWKATNPIVPSNPVLSLTGSRRFGNAPGLSEYNWYASLSQEIEIAGQRGARKRLVGAERDAQTQTLVATQRDAVADAWDAYFEALAAKDDLDVASRLEQQARRMYDAVQGATSKGLGSGVDADVSDANLVRLTQARVVAIARRKSALSSLASKLGLDPTTALDVTGDLEPLAVAAAITTPNVEQLPDVRALTAQSHAYASQADYYRRARFPNLTLSVFAENDEVNQPVVGFGLALPIVFPQPIGRTYEGEILESESLSRKLMTDAEEKKRVARRDIATARQAYDASMQVRNLYSPERIARAQKSLESIATEIEAGRLLIRDAIVAQQTLVEMLRASIEARRAVCVASVALAKAAGVALERGAS